MIDEKKILEIIKKMDLDIEIKHEDFSKPFNELNLDSLDVFNLISEVEIQENIKINDDDFEKIKSISNLITFLKK